MDKARLKKCIDYYQSHAPSPDVLARFSGNIGESTFSLPLYDEASDTLSCIVDLMFTKAIAFDIPDTNMGMFAERYCFEDPLLAFEELIAWHQRGFNDQRPAGWVACRGVSARQIKVSFETYHSETYGMELMPYASHVKPPLHSFIVANASRISQELGYDLNEVKHLAAYLKQVGKVL